MVWLKVHVFPGPPLDIVKLIVQSIWGRNRAFPGAFGGLIGLGDWDEETISSNLVKFSVGRFWDPNHGPVDPWSGWMCMCCGGTTLHSKIAIPINQGQNSHAPWGFLRFDRIGRLGRRDK
jgi:hypothetical protein